MLFFVHEKLSALLNEYWYRTRGYLYILHPSWDYSVPSFRESTVRTIPVSCIIFDEINHTKGILWERIIQRI